MAGLFVHIKVRDYQEWKKGFDANSSFRTNSGAQSGQIFTDADDPNMVYILFKWNSIENAKKFSQSPELKAAMQKAGVEGPPHFHYLKEM
jgi:quinol monooxygenase YgiN